MRICAFLNFEAATIFMALVICFVLVTAMIFRLMSFNAAIKTYSLFL
jgi:hypothetical protein